MQMHAAPNSAMYRFPKRSCRYPAYGHAAAIARILAVGSQAEPLVRPRSSAMKPSEPPVKYRMTCEPGTLVSPSCQSGVTEPTSVEAREEDSGEDAAKGPVDLSIRVVS